MVVLAISTDSSAQGYPPVLDWVFLVQLETSVFRIVVLISGALVALAILVEALVPGFLVVLTQVVVFSGLLET